MLRDRANLPLFFYSDLRRKKRNLHQGNRQTAKRPCVDPTRAEIITEANVRWDHLNSLICRLPKSDTLAGSGYKFWPVVGRKHLALHSVASQIAQGAKLERAAANAGRDYAFNTQVRFDL